MRIRLFDRHLWHVIFSAAHSTKTQTIAQYNYYDYDYDHLLLFFFLLCYDIRSSCDDDDGDFYANDFNEAVL